MNLIANLICTGLLNLRGSDFEYTPLFFAYGIVTEETTYLYMLKQERITTEIDNHFQTDYIDIKIHEYNETMAGINTVVSIQNFKIVYIFIT